MIEPCSPDRARSHVFFFSFSALSAFLQRGLRSAFQETSNKVLEYSEAATRDAASRALIRCRGET